MKKVFKFLVWVVVLVVVIAVLAFAALYIFADPNKLKPVISSEVQKRTGYQLIFDGDLSWSLYPQLGVKAAHVTLQAPNQQKPFIDLKRIHIAVEPMQLLYGYHKLRGEVHIAEVTFMNVHATSALVGLHWQDQSIVLRPIQASLYGGSLSGNARGKDFGAVPAWNWELTLSHVDMQPLLHDANGDASKLILSGTGQVKISASTQGLDAKQMMSNLNGVTDFSVQNGAVEGIDLNYLLQTADALLNKKQIELPTDINQTKFDSMAGSVLINNGLAQTNNLLLTSAAFKVKGQGSYSLPAQTIDLALQVAPPENQWDIPVLVRGEVSRPTVQLDMREINKQVASRELAQVKDKVRDKIKEKIPGKAGEYLSNLLGK
jgi:AsmA protein